ncbi:uncharacterized protein LOC112226049 [Oncorhynchus tshawytscha]|uniref:uncharacterized protein LOC112226049 n=1 Tax=Oncorhynchus tshawytscha TaxID=74940 RepID=UPI001C3E4212|nr:uncharacterized protein LOC112226049 [Oncorhynchus tshawytscha]
MDRQRQLLIYTDFIELNDTKDPNCVNHSNNSADWLKKYFGLFVGFAPLEELKRLHGNFSVVDGCPAYAEPQAAGGGGLYPWSAQKPWRCPHDTDSCDPRDLDEFFDIVSPAVEGLHLPVDVRQVLLQQVFDNANLSDPSIKDPEVLVWLGQRLRPLLPNLTEEHVAPLFNIIRHRHCNTSQETVYLLGSKLTFNGSAITQDDAYSTIKTYLNTGSSAAPKCYSPSDPNLNSTAWFLNYIGVFITFVTIEDFNTFGSESTLKLFAVNPVNIELFNFAGAPQNLTKRFTELIFLQNSNFLPLQLPPHLQCFVTASAYSKLNESASVVVRGNLNQSCTNVDSGITSALAFVWDPSPGSITALGPQINNTDSLINLGSLVGGLPTQTLTTIPEQQVLTTSAYPTFVTNMLTAPTIVQQIYVNKIITVNMKPTELIVNVPDEMATDIPSNLLNFPTTGNQTHCSEHQQEKMETSAVANGLDEPHELSPKQELNLSSELADVGPVEERWFSRRHR